MVLGHHQGDVDKNMVHARGGAFGVELSGRSVLSETSVCCHAHRIHGQKGLSRDLVVEGVLLRKIWAAWLAEELCALVYGNARLPRLLPIYPLQLTLFPAKYLP